MKKTMVIIGSNSFFGSNFVNYILENTDWRVIGASRSPEPPAFLLPYIYKKKKSPRFTFFRLSIVSDLPKLIKIIDRVKPEAVVNFAAQSNVDRSWDDPEDWFLTNCLALVNLVNHLKSQKYLKKFIQISTPEVYGPCDDLKETANHFNPASPYSASKAAGDLFLLALANHSGFPVSFVRASNIYGPHQQPYRIIPYSIIRLKKGEKIQLKTPKVRRNFIHIKDASAGIYKVVLKGKTGAVYHLTSKSIISIEDLAKMICRKAGFKPEEKWIEILKRQKVKRDVLYGLNFVRTKKELDWQPEISLSRGLNETIQWVEENWQQLKNYPLHYIYKSNKQ